MILIVDDKPENIFALKSILELNHFPVDTAESGEEALRKILKTNYTLVILDVQMPEMDGFEVAEMMMSYSKSKDTPIIFLSAISKEKKFITKGYKAGAVDYITKPVDPDILLMKVSSLYAISEQRTDLKRMQQVLLKEIDARKNSEKKLAQKNDEMHSVMESMPQMAFTVNNAGRIEYVNKNWIDFLGPEMQFPVFHSDDGSALAKWERSFKRNEAYSSEVKLMEQGTDRYRHFLLKIIPVSQNGHVSKWVGTFTDIEQQKSVNELLEQKVEERTSELLDKNRELENFNQELQQVNWVLSHDLKEPLRKILTYGNLISERYLEEEDPAMPYFKRIIDSSERMSRLISDLLDFSKLPGGLELTEVDLNKVVAEVLSDLEVIIHQSQASVKVSDLPVIEASPSHIRQLFQNLIGNALKFTKPGEKPEVIVSGERVQQLDFDSPVSPDGNYCRIIIADKGIGFDEKFLEKIFMIFQRLDRKSTEGTGIGLAIVKKIVEKHNGIITARSKEAEGASFIIVLPIKK